jgi:hypothetical protein
LSLTSTIAKPLAAAIALSLGGAAVAETIVVKSAGPSARAYPPGKSIADNSKVALKAGDSVTILDGRGTRILKGPGTFATTTTTATGSSFNALLRNTGTRQVRTGAVRSVGIGAAPTRPPNVWLVDATKSGTVCVAGTEAVSVWVPPHDAVANLTVTRVADGRSAPLAFRALQTVRSWPSADLPIHNGDQFRVSGDGMTNPVTIRFAMLGPNPQGLERTASALITAGCTAQLDLLIETVAAPGDTESTGG